MALLFMDGFDAKDPGIKWKPSYGGYGGWGAGSSSYFRAGRFGSGTSLEIRRYSSYTAWMQTSFTPSSLLTVGFAAKLDANYQFLLLYGDDSVTLHLSLRNNSTGTIDVLRGSTVIASAPADSYSPGIWHYWEVQASVDSTAGRVIVRIDGSKVIDFTGNTRNGGTSVMLDTLKLTGNGATDPGVTLDDLYILNSTGTTNNDFLGDVRVQSLVPNGAGSFTQFVPTGATENWQNASDVPYNTTRYNSSDTVGDRDTYTLTDTLSGTGAVYGVQTNMIAAKGDAGSAGLKSVLISDGTTHYGPDRNLNASPIQSRVIYDQNPATGSAWTVSSVDNLEIGAEVV